MQDNQFYDLDFDINNVIYFLPSYIYWKDSNSVYRGCNANLAKISDLNSPQEIVGKTDFDFVWGTKDAQSFIDEDKYVIKTGETLTSEWIMPHKNSLGLPYILRTEKKPLLGKSGKAIGVIGISYDISAEKEAEKLRLQAKIQQAVMEEQSIFRNFIGKMVHDIKSPLISLKNLVQSATEFSEAKRTTLHSAATTISNIAEQMIRKYVDHGSTTNNQCQHVLLSDLIEQLVSEKQFEYGIDIQFDLCLKNGVDFAFIKIDPVKFKRMLSNVINNAIDATKTKDSVRIRINLSGHLSDKYVVSVVDNGIGMSKSTIGKIMAGKMISRNKSNGHGLGMAQVMETLDESSGFLTIDSKQEKGTTVSLLFPRAITPPWFTSTVKITDDTLIVILDDEPSIHGTWDLRLQEVTIALPKIRILHFQQGCKALNFINALSHQDKQRVCLLSDYELINEDLNGLCVIQQTGIKRAILITSHYADSKIQLQALEAGVKILPKSLEPKVIIKLYEKPIPNSRRVDAAWLDDAFLELTNIIKDDYKHLKIDMHEDPVIFLEDLGQYPLDTKIIFDYYFYFDYDERVMTMNGLTLAEQLHNKGYTDLYLCTAEDMVPDKIPPYLKYVSKTDVLESKSLRVLFGLK